MRDPDLQQFLDKRLTLHLSNSREVAGTLRGFDAFMNVVLEGAVDKTNGKEPVKLGTTMIRGVSIVSIVEP